MSERATTRVEPERASNWLRLGFGLLLTPCAVALALCVFPRLHLGSGLTSVIAFAGATAFPILGLAAAATAQVRLAVALGSAAAALTALLALAWFQPSLGSALLLADTALVCVSWALGTSLGRRVQHAAHLLPACVVAASADLASLLSPEGPSHAIAESDRALSVLAVWFPVPGGHQVAPALGVGDLLFMALVFGVARAHALPYARTLGLCALGTGLAGFGAIRFGVAIPALVPIAGALMLGLPSIRRLRRADRAAAWASMLIAGSVALATLARSFFSPH